MNDTNFKAGGMAELVDASDLSSGTEMCMGSSPISSTNKQEIKKNGKRNIQNLWQSLND